MKLLTVFETSLLHEELATLKAEKLESPCWLLEVHPKSKLGTGIRICSITYYENCHNLTDCNAIPGCKKVFGLLQEPVFDHSYCLWGYYESYQSISAIQPITTALHTAKPLFRWVETILSTISFDNNLLQLLNVKIQSVPKNYYLSAVCLIA